jgi:hypothetical protein
MDIFLGFLVILGCFIIGTIVGYLIRMNGRQTEIKNWKIGDKLTLERDSQYYQELQNNKVDYAILKGWTLNNLYINCGDDFVHKVSWSCLDVNKDALWRRNFEEAKKVMGCDPEFPNGVGDSSSSSSKGEVNGKPIELLSEIECQVQLKLAIENEDYTLADKLRKRMEKFR